MRLGRRIPAMGTPIFALLVGAVLVVVSLDLTVAAASYRPELLLGPDPDPKSLPAPATMRGFAIWITDQQGIQEEVHADVAYLYQEIGIVQLRNIRVTFFSDTEGTDTLDAPEGFLYLRDFSTTESRIRPDFPFYNKLGGRYANIEALTSGTAVEDLPPEVLRHRNDLDAIGRSTRKIIYRRADGTEASCLRAYRDAETGTIHGIGECKSVVRPKKSQADIISSGVSQGQKGYLELVGDAFIAEGRGTGVRILGPARLKSAGGK